MTRSILAALLLLLTPAATWAAAIEGEPAPVVAWTFNDLAREAAATHPAVLAKRLEQDAAAAETEAARWQRWPLPGVEASQDDRGDRSTVFSLQQPLWSGGKISAGIAGAEARHGAAGAAVGVARREILRRLIDAFSEVRRRQAQQEILYRNVQQHERLLAMISRRVEQEVSPRVDLDLANSRLYQAANDLSFVTQALHLGLTRLSELSGKPVYKVTAAAADASAGELPTDGDEVLDLALANSPTLAGLERERLAAEADVRSASASYWPLLALRLEKREGTLSDERAMLVLQTQLGAGLSTGANVSAATARREAISAERAAAIREVRTETAEFWQQLTASRLRRANSRLHRESAATVFESYTRQYVIGQKSWLDVLNAVREASNASLTVEDAEAEMLRSDLNLRLLIGQLNQFRKVADAGR